MPREIDVRLRLLSGAAFRRDLREAGKEVDRFGRTVETSTKRHLAVAGRDIQSYGSTVRRTTSGIGIAALDSLAVVRRAATGIGIAVGTAGASAGLMGLKFDAGMEQSRVAFTNLLGSGQAAERMLGRLYRIAATTPFEFPQLVQSTQLLLGFGMAAKDVVPTMKAVGDAVAATGGGAEQIGRVSLALGQIQAKGKVSSEELLQLAEGGVPAFKILQTELGLTGRQLTQKLAGGAISADKGIAALVAGIEQRYRGMAAAQSKTFSGMLSTLKDNVRLAAGAIAKPLFDALEQDVLPVVMRISDEIASWARRPGGLKRTQTAFKAGLEARDFTSVQGFSGIAGTAAKAGVVLGVAFKTVKDYAVEFWDALKPITPFLQNILLPLLKGLGLGLLYVAGAGFKLLIPIVRVVATALGWLGQKAKPLRGLFEGIGKVMGVMASGPMFFLTHAFKLLQLAVETSVRYIRRDLDGIVDFVAGLGRRIASAASGLWDGLKGGLAAAINWIVDRLNTIHFSIPSWVPGIGGKGFGIHLQHVTTSAPHRGPVTVVPAGARGFGGTVSAAGPYVVGERGPETVQLPPGARVQPLTPAIAAALGQGGRTGGPLFAEITLMLDGQVLTKQVTKVERRSAARK